MKNYKEFFELLSNILIYMSTHEDQYDNNDCEYVSLINSYNTLMNSAHKKINYKHIVEEYSEDLLDIFEDKILRSKMGINQFSCPIRISGAISKTFSLYLERIHNKVETTH